MMKTFIGIGLDKEKDSVKLLTADIHEFKCIENCKAFESSPSKVTIVLNFSDVNFSSNVKKWLEIHGATKKEQDTILSSICKSIVTALQKVV